MAGPIDDPWGAPERYYTKRKYRPEHGPVSKSWEESLSRVAPDTAQAVERAVDLWNLKSKGWRRIGLIEPAEVPGDARDRRGQLRRTGASAVAA